MLRRHLLLCGLMIYALAMNWSQISAEPAAENAPDKDRDNAAADEPDDADDEPLPAKPAGKKGHKLTAEQTTPTHMQVRVIQPAHDGKPVSLATFCLARNGNILACVAEHSLNAEVPEDEAPPRKQKTQSFVQEYSCDGKLLHEIPVSFSATAINIAPNGEVFIAGEGKMARIVDGKVTGETPTPHIGDYETFKKQVLEAAKEEVAEFCKDFDEQIEALKEKIAALETKSKEQELTKREQAQLKSSKQALNVQEQQVQAITGSMGDPDEQVRERLVVTALAVTGEDVFVSVMSVKGHGYEVWRTDHEFKQPKKVVASLSGCCGQMDIQARGDRLFVAENGKFQISVRDRDGKRLASFGKRDRNSVDGFGSCCNPMNLRCCDNGDILAAESSIGNIKRFNAQGEFVGLIGKAKIGIGCKHVALASDESRDHYYMMNVDRGHIAVLIPAGEVPPETEAEKTARIARDGFSQRLVGQWEREVLDPKKKAAKNPLVGLIGSLVGADDEEGLRMPEHVFDAVTFSANGKIQVDGGMLGIYARDSELSWEGVALNGKVLDVTFNMDGAEFTSAKIEMVSDDEVEICSQNFGSGEFGKKFKFKRQKTAEKPKTEKRR